MSRKTSIILSILPLILLTVVVFHFSINIPYWDQWEFVPLLQKSYEGNFTFNDFWVPHNEHRPVFPRLIILGLARLTNWNIRWELVVNILLSIGTYIVIVRSVNQALFSNSKFKSQKSKLQFKMQNVTTLDITMGDAREGSRAKFQRHDQAGLDDLVQFEDSQRETRAAGPVNYNSMYTVVALIIFSLTQWENWVWGWQIQVFLNVFAVCLGFYFLTKSYNNKIYFITSILCGIIATFSFANGLLFWPIGFFILTSLARSHLAKLIWILVSILIYAIYLPGLPTQFDILSVFNNLLLYLSYVTAFLGAPVFGLHPVVASILGVFGLLIFLSHTRCVKDKSFFFSLGLYAILSAFFTGLGRYNLGSLQAISSRYITFANLLWLSNIVFLYTGKIKKIRAISIIILVIFLITTTSLYRIKTVIKRYNDLSTAQTALFTGTSDILLEKLYYSGEVVKERMKILNEIFNK